MRGQQWSENHTDGTNTRREGSCTPIDISVPHVGSLPASHIRLYHPSHSAWTRGFPAIGTSPLLLLLLPPRRRNTDGSSRRARATLKCYGTKHISPTSVVGRRARCNNSTTTSEEPAASWTTPVKLIYNHIELTKKIIPTNMKKRKNSITYFIWNPQSTSKKHKSHVKHNYRRYEKYEI